MKPRLALVTWDDICDVLSEDEQAWFLQEDAIKLSDRPESICRSIGWVLRKDKRWLLLASTEGLEFGERPMTYSGLHKIPQGCVRSIRWLK